MIQVKGTLLEMKKLYNVLGLVDVSTPRTLKNGNIHYVDPIASRQRGYEVRYTFNPKSGIIRRRRRNDYVSFLNSRETKTFTESGYKYRIPIPIHDLAEQMSRALSPIVKYRQ